MVGEEGLSKHKEHSERVFHGELPGKRPKRPRVKRLSSSKPAPNANDSAWLEFKAMPCLPNEAYDGSKVAKLELFSYANPILKHVKVRFNPQIYTLQQGFQGKGVEEVVSGPQEQIQEETVVPLFRRVQVQVDHAAIGLSKGKVPMPGQV
jgi:hypothetical protein